MINTKWILLFVLAAFVVPSVHAWAWDTHQALAESVCPECDKSCLDRGAIAPDKEFKDAINHHVYRQCVQVNPEWCEAGKICYDCSQGNITDDVAEEKARFWLEQAKQKQGQNDSCDYSYDLGVATHYFFDSKVYFHQTKNEDYSRCHAKLEDEVNKEFIVGNSDWQACACGVCVNAVNFDIWKTQFFQFENGSQIATAQRACEVVGKCGSTYSEVGAPQQNTMINEVKWAVQRTILDRIGFWWISLWQKVI